MRTTAGTALRAVLFMVLACAPRPALASGDCVTRAADRLVDLQDLGGSWTGETGFTGSIVAGLVRAYTLTGTVAYRTAAEDGGNWILDSSAPNFYGDEAYALTGLSAIAPDPADNPWRTSVSTYYEAVRQSEGGTSDYIGDFATTEPSTAVFYLANHAVAASYVGAADGDAWRDGLVSYLATVSDAGSNYPVMALGAAVWGLALTGDMDATPVAPAATETSPWHDKHLSHLPGMLLSHQVETGVNAGGFYWRFDHAAPDGGDTSGFTEDAVFGTLGLATANEANPALGYNDAILKGQTALAGGVTSDGTVYEHLRALGVSYHAYAGETLQALPDPAMLNEWTLTGAGSHNAAPNWRAGTVPDGVDATANLLGNITGDSTVTVDADVTLGTLNFASEHAYTVDGPAAVTLDASGDARVNLLRGSHVIAAPLVLDSALEMTTPPESELTISGLLDNSAGETLTKIGDGTLTITGPQLHSLGAELLVQDGTVNLNADAGSNESANLSISVSGGAVLNFGWNQHLDTLTLGPGSKVVVAGAHTIVVKHLVFDEMDFGAVVLTPEPATLVLLALGGLGVLVRRR